MKKPAGEEIEVCKVKGITLNYKTKKLINFHWMRLYVKGNKESSLLIEYDGIRRTQFHDVITRKEKKIVCLYTQSDGFVVIIFRILMDMYNNILMKLLNSNLFLIYNFSTFIHV